MKLEVSEKDIDRLIKSRVTEFNKIERDLKSKLVRRDNKIHKLQREIEILQAGKMDEDRETAELIAKIAKVLIGTMQRANWIEKYEDSGVYYCADE